MDNLNLGLRTQKICINGDKNKTISFCPDDINIVSRYQESLEEFEKIKNEISDLNQNMDSENITESIKKIFQLDNVIKEKIDYIFNSDISKIAFGEVSCLAIGSNGVPLFQNLLEKLIEYCTNSYSGKVDDFKNSDKASKYLSKYKNKCVKNNDYKKSNKHNNKK